VQLRQGALTPGAASEPLVRRPNPIPFLAVLASVGLMLGADGGPVAHGAFGELVVGASMLTLLVVARLLSTLRENRRLLAETRRDLERRRALLHVARRVAAEADPEMLLATLLDEAQAMLGAASGSVYRWDAGGGELVLVSGRTRIATEMARRIGDQGVVGTAARTRAAVIVNDYPHSARALPDAVAAGVQAVLAVPLLHEGRLLGALRIGSYTPGVRYTQADADALELLASLVSATLAGLERARVAAVTLAARELAHRLNNHLALPMGAMELVLQQHGLPPHLEQMLRAGADGLSAASADVTDLLKLVRFETKQTPIGPALDLERSTRAEPE
jgi:putative methionine-R-sulfoxide reductase with GAF domain